MPRQSLQGLTWAAVPLLCVLCSACEAPVSRVPPELETALAVNASALSVSSSYIDIRLRTGSGVSIGRTCGAANEVSPTCASGQASDFNHHWISPYDGTFTFSTQGAGTNFDTVLQITRWSDSVPLGCGDDASGTLQSSVTLNLAANQELRITVDGKGSACGLFQLDITGVPSTCGPCNTPPSPCHERNGTCSGTTCVYAMKPTGSACDDGNACTVSDTCGGSGICQGTPMACNSPPGQCYASPGTCNNGTCQYAPKPAGSWCEDGDSCTSSDSCSGSGWCYSGQRVCCANGGWLCNGFCCGTNEYCDGLSCRANCDDTSGPVMLRPMCPVMY
jgi:hypothetical protein